MVALVAKLAEEVRRLSIARWAVDNSRTGAASRWTKAPPIPRVYGAPNPDYSDIAHRFRLGQINQL